MFPDTKIVNYTVVNGTMNDVFFSPKINLTFRFFVLNLFIIG